MKSSDIFRNTAAEHTNHISSILRRWGKNVYILCIFVAVFSMGFTSDQQLRSFADEKSRERRRNQASKVTYSWNEGMLGPCLLDLQDRTGVSFTSASTYITAVSIGSFIGVMGFLFLHRYVNTFLVFAVSCLVGGVSMLVLAWCYTYTALFLDTLVIGICRGFQFTYSISETSSLKEGGRSTYLSVLLILRMVGSAASPIVVSPYLSDRPMATTFGSANSSHELLSKRNDQNTVSSSTSQLITPLAISATFSIVPVPFFFLLFSMSLLRQFEIKYTSVETRQSSQLPTPYGVTSIILFSTLLGITCGLSTGCRHFLSAFTTQQFHYSRAISAYLAGVFSFSGLIGRLFTTVLLPFQGYTSLFIFQSALLVTSSGALYICSVYNLGFVEIFVSVSFMALSSYALIGLLFMVADETLFPVTGSILSFAISMELIGVITNSLLKGILMQEYGSIQFVVIILVQAVALFLLVFPFVGLVETIKLNFRSSVNDNT